MESKELKAQHSMAEIVERYGFRPNRAGFIHCPFHNGDNDASMKIYKDSYHCFGCGANGDIFTFIQNMEHCDFKTAFKELGGTYDKPTNRSRIALYRSKKKSDQKEVDLEKVKKKKELNNMLIDIYRNYMNKSEPFSDTWCDCCNALQYQLYVQEEINREEMRT